MASVATARESKYFERASYADNYDRKAYANTAMYAPPWSGKRGSEYDLLSHSCVCVISFVASWWGVKVPTNVCVSCSAGLSRTNQPHLVLRQRQTPTEQQWGYFSLPPCGRVSARCVADAQFSACAIEILRVLLTLSRRERDRSPLL